MSSTAQRRKGGSAVKASPSSDSALTNRPPVAVATVRRRFCGTGAFDKHWLNVDCCGLLCAMITYCLHMYALYTVCFVLIPPWMSVTTAMPSADGVTSVRSLTWMGVMHRVCFGTLTMMAVVSHFKAMTTDPGTVPPDAKPIEDIPEPSEVDSLTTFPRKGHRLCRRCKAFKPERAHHCSVCKRCIIKMDHHCPWVNNCVGIGNHKYFLLFVFYTFLTCCYSLTIVIFRFATCVQRHEHGVHRHSTHIACLDHPTQMLNVLGLLIEGLLFGMFTSCMMFDQSDVIRSKLTHIDRLKGDADLVGGSLAGVIEVFGIGSNSSSCGATSTSTKFRWDWISPFCSTRYPASAVDEVMGFCRHVRNTAMKDMTVNTAATGNAPGEAEMAGLRRMEEVV